MENLKDYTLEQLRGYKNLVERNIQESKKELTRVESLIWEAEKVGKNPEELLALRLNKSLFGEVSSRMIDLGNKPGVGEVFQNWRLNYQMGEDLMFGEFLFGDGLYTILEDHSLGCIEIEDVDADMRNLLSHFSTELALRKFFEIGMKAYRVTFTEEEIETDLLKIVTVWKGSNFSEHSYYKTVGDSIRGLELLARYDSLNSIQRW